MPTIHTDTGAPSGAPFRPTLAGALAAAHSAIDAGDKACELLEQIERDLEMRRPLREIRLLLEDVEVWTTLAKRETDRIYLYINHMKEKHGWHD